MKNHLYPALGHRRLDEIVDEDVQRLKANLSSRAPRTVNNVLTVLGKLLRVGARWKVIAAVPCSIDLLRVTLPLPKFHDYFARRHIQVQQQMWRRVIDTPKSGRGRIVPMTEALTDALRRHQAKAHERWVFTTPAGGPPSYRTLRKWLLRLCRKAGVKDHGGAHVLRHSFCSHLAMRGAPAKAIQELAGHIHLTTTQRYMHLSPHARDGAIALLDRRPVGEVLGEILETGS